MLTGCTLAAPGPMLSSGSCWFGSSAMFSLSAVRYRLLAFSGWFLPKNFGRALLIYFLRTVRNKDCCRLRLQAQIRLRDWPSDRTQVIANSGDYLTEEHI